MPEAIFGNEVDIAVDTEDIEAPNAVGSQEDEADRAYVQIARG